MKKNSFKIIAVAVAVVMMMSVAFTGCSKALKVPGKSEVMSKAKTIVNDKFSSLAKAGEEAEKKALSEVKLVSESVKDIAEYDFIRIGDKVFVPAGAIDNPQNGNPLIDLNGSEFLELPDAFVKSDGFAALTEFMNGLYSLILESYEEKMEAGKYDEETKTYTYEYKFSVEDSKAAFEKLKKYVEDNAGKVADGTVGLVNYMLTKLKDELKDSEIIKTMSEATGMDFGAEIEKNMNLNDIGELKNSIIDSFKNLTVDDADIKERAGTVVFSEIDGVVKITITDESGSLTISTEKASTDGVKEEKSITLDEFVDSLVKILEESFGALIGGGAS